MPTATEIAAAIRTGATTASDVVQPSIRRIDALDGDLQAWVEVDRAGAEEAALSPLPGPLSGVPVGLKDIIDAAGLSSRKGAAPFAHTTPSVDATGVARLRAAGAIVLGKTHTTQFAYLDPAPTFNPWHRERTPGGSSSGSAAAVAAGMVPIALGTQTVGSILRPAAYCGVVGLKPTFGRVPYTGVAYLAPHFDHLGAICACVADAALALQVMAGFDAADPHSADAPVDNYLAALQSPPAPRVGLARSFYTGVASDEVTQHLDSVAERLAGAGASIVDVAMPAAAGEIAAMGQPVLRAEAAQVHAEAFAAHRDEYAPGIRSLIESGLEVKAVDLLRARDQVRDLGKALRSVLGGIDVILMPVAPATAPGRETTGNSIFCAPASFTGLPAIALPSGLGVDGLPLAVQLIAGPFAEAGLLAAAAWVERLLAFSAKPPLPAS